MNKSCFSLTGSALATFKLLKSELADVSLWVIDEKQQFVVERDGSNVVLSATLNQNNQSVAFFSRSLTKSVL